MEVHKKKIAVSGGPMKREVASLMAISMAAAAAVGEPYLFDGFKLPRARSYRGTVIRCAGCGASGTTLYKMGDERYCKTCKEKMSDE